MATAAHCAWLLAFRPTAAYIPRHSPCHDPSSRLGAKDAGHPLEKPKSRWRAGISSGKGWNNAGNHTTVTDAGEPFREWIKPRPSRDPLKKFHAWLACLRLGENIFRDTREFFGGAMIETDWRRPWMKRAVVMLLLGTLVTACTTPPLGRADLLGFIHDGRTSREETYLHLGEPSALYEGERIMSFRLGRDEGGYFVVGKATGFAGVTTSLIMVFDEQGVLRRHALVQVKAP